MNGITAADHDHAGHRYIAWNDKRNQASGSLSSIMFARSDDNGQTWSTPIRIDNEDGAAVGYVGRGTHLKVDDNGHIYVLWDDLRAGLPAPQLYMAHFRRRRKNLARQGRADRTKQRDRRHDASTELLADELGNLYVYWTDLRSGTESRIYTISSRDYGTRPFRLSSDWTSWPRTAPTAWHRQARS
ncbi:MAG: sialidase family protein [Candidatus Andersenbacteria bacterium]